MVKYYYENLLSNQNLTATTNIAWVADITTLRLFRDQKAYIFLCIDIHTNYIVAALISKQPITAQSIIRSLERGIKQRLKISKKKLIIHTDRGTQFSSKMYNTFTKKYKDYFNPSMARENTSTDNSVADNSHNRWNNGVHNFMVLRRGRFIGSTCFNSSKLSSISKPISTDCKSTRFSKIQENTQQNVRRRRSNKESLRNFRRCKDFPKK